MGQTDKTKKTERNERHSAAWGKRVSLMMLLAAGMAFGQQSNVRGSQERAFSDALSPEVTHLINRWGANSAQPLKVIVQYKHAPKVASWTRAQNLGGRMSHNLRMINSMAYTVPAGRLG
jgi:hypothetical protein